MSKSALTRLRRSRSWNCPASLALFAALTVAPDLGAALEESILVRKGNSTYGMTLSTDSTKATPEMLLRAKEAIDTATELEKAKATKRMAEEIRQLTAAAGLTPAQVKELEASANKAVSQCVEVWSARVSPLLALINQIVSGLPPLSVRDVLGTTAATAETAGELAYLHPVWIAALQSTLTPEQQVAWKAADDDRRRRWIPETMERIQPMIAESREQLLKLIPEQALALKRSLSISPARAKELHEQACKLADQHVANWEERIRTALAAAPSPEMDRLGVTAMLGRGAIKGLPLRPALWAEVLEKSFSPIERKQIDELTSQRARRRKDGLGRVVLAGMEERIGFTELQRQKLLPLAMRLVRDETRVQNIVESLLGEMQRVTDEDLKPILDEVQLARWRGTPPGDGQGGLPARLQGKKGPAPTAPAPEPDENGDEDVISEFLRSRVERESKALLQRMLLKAEDAARVIPLSSDRATCLFTAARGAAEQVLTKFRSDWEAHVRGHLRAYEGQSPNARRAELTTMGGNEERSPGWEPERKPIWTNALQRLTEPEQAKWRQSGVERAAFRRDAYSKAVLALFDESIEISAAQWSRLEPLVSDVISEYLPDLEPNAADVSGCAWLSESGDRIVPLVAIETELKNILEPDQWDRWNSDGEVDNAKEDWSRIKLAHAERLKPKARTDAGPQNK